MTLEYNTPSEIPDDILQTEYAATLARVGELTRKLKTLHRNCSRIEKQLAELNTEISPMAFSLSAAQRELALIAGELAEREM